MKGGLCIRNSLEVMTLFWCGVRCSSSCLGNQLQLNSDASIFKTRRTIGQGGKKCVGQEMSKKSGCFTVVEFLHAAVARSVLGESCFALFSQANVTSSHELECNTGGRFGGKMLWLVDAFTEVIVLPPPALLVFGDGPCWACGASAF